DRRSAISPEARGGAHVAPRRRGPEDAVAEAVVAVPVRVDDDRHGLPGQLAQLSRDLTRLGWRRPRIHDEHVPPTEDDPDLLVEERVLPREDAVDDLSPAHRGRWYRRPTLGVGCRDGRRSTGRSRSDARRHDPPD